jgi:hypothetical protein
VVIVPYMRLENRTGDHARFICAAGSKFSLASGASRAD